MAETAAAQETVDFRKPGFAVSLLGALLPGLYLLITSTTTLVTSIWPYDFKRMLEFGLLFVLFLLPIVNRPIREEFGALLAGVPRWVGWTLVFVFAWGVLSASVNARSWMHYANSLSEVALLGSLVLGAFMVGACRRVSGQVFDQVAIGLIALTGLVVGTQELLGVLAAHASGVEFNFRISLLNFSWPRFYNQVQSWTVPVIAALPLLFTRYSLAKFLCVLVLGLHWYVILMTGARGSVAALSGAFLFALVFLPPARSYLLKWQVPGILLGALIYAGVLYSFQTATLPENTSAPATSRTEVSPRGHYGNRDANTSEFLAQSIKRPLLDPTGRTWMWKLALRDAAAHPVLGIGPMNYVCTSPTPLGHPHNFLLQLAAEWGIPVGLAVAGLLAALLLRGVAMVRETDSQSAAAPALNALLLTGILAAAIHAMVSGVMVMPASQVMGMTLIGMLIAAVPAPRAAASMPRTSNGALAAGLVFSVGLLLLGARELKTMPDRSELLTPDESMWPRVWQDSQVCRSYIPQNPVTN